MRAFLLHILFSIIAIASYGQKLDFEKVKMYGDKVLADSIKSYRNLRPEAYEIRTTDKQGIYHYYEVRKGKRQLIPESIAYSVYYKLYYSTLNFHTELEIPMGRNFKLTDSSVFADVPGFIKENRQRDLITKDSAISIAKANRLASGDSLTVYLFKQLKSGQFFWTVKSEWKAYLKKLALEYKDKGGPRRRRSRPNDELFVNARTGEVYTREEMRNQN